MRDNRGKKRRSLKEKLLYCFDLWLSKGTISMTILLFLAIGAFTLLIGTVSMIIDGENTSVKEAMWSALNHTIDSGTLGGDEGNPVFIALMIFSTFIGLFFMAMLIGLVSDAIRSRVRDLSKGLEPVVEKDHFVILGFNESTFIILGELIEAYRNRHRNKNTVVVMDQLDKIEMEDRIRTVFPDTGNLRIVCRSGSVSSKEDLYRCSVETCRSILITVFDDFETIKSILACTKILDDSEDSRAYITSVIYGRENEYAARIAGNDSGTDSGTFTVKNDRLELLMMENTISKIMTQTCRQNGMSRVFTEILDFEGDEFYIADPEQNESLYEEMRGRSIREINRFLPEAVAIGVVRSDGTTVIDEPDAVTLEQGGRLIILQENDDPVVMGAEEKGICPPPALQYQSEPASVLIIGCNEKLPYILREMSECLSPGTIIHLASDPDELDQWLTDQMIEEMLEKGIDFSVCIQRGEGTEESVSKGVKREAVINKHKTLYRLLSACRPSHVLYLASDTMEDDKADERALKILLYCKDYQETHPEENFGITCEMRKISNQQLAQGTMDSDFVISHNIASLMMAQIAKTRELMKVFEIILSNEGFEVYIKPAKYYFSAQSGEEIDFYAVQEAVADKGEIFLGYKKKMPDGYDIVLNPAKLENGKRTGIIFTEEDELVVLAEDMEIRA
ncbi:MAG: hypothetical protein Q4F43_06470 [Eubacteriales bacterium]|nr:hypothetical protein [Eubacteriales bacterium]